MDVQLATGEKVMIYPDQVIKVSRQSRLVEGLNQDTNTPVVVKLSHIFPRGRQLTQVDADELSIVRELEILPRLAGIAGVPQYIGAIRLPLDEATERIALMMSRMPGTDLEEWRKRDPQRRLTTAEALDMLRQTAAILSAVHQRHVIHCDLKLSNFMCDETGQYSIIDWATAQYVLGNHTDQTSLRSKRTVIGTVQFMSPEQITGKALDQRSDIYSLGALIALLRYGSHISQRYVVAADGTVTERSKPDIAQAIAKQESIKYQLWPTPASAAEQQLQIVLKRMTNPNRAERFHSLVEFFSTTPCHIK